ncbi:hypothetical protein vB_PsyM_KIL4_0128 [Pseudomonas phage vB_PsyM_KIL4]|uniref:Uncharacterized protein n=2 Tax=Flaumdravirus TaxID=2560133 RepID=A0A142IE76_9CAUD|nr:thymidylate synthase [Pseudomonas phage vB_PsyM_KIL4]AMR57531.1 hypothetical protein vB_PsyM_KIL2_0131 [Pseudomonas phage vB_PsyM_KIL2]AMR57852.1 hypothetical protein vB_PsyM_KIL4_0128 [Pseudomonas phage vB_PsyM_KIL4]
MTDYALSFHDLALVDGFNEALTAGNIKIFEGILSTNGMDISMGYEIEDCTHRTLTGKSWHGPRVAGQERLDKAWLATGCASLEAQIEATKDKTLRHTLRAMSYQGTITPTAED